MCLVNYYVRFNDKMNLPGGFMKKTISLVLCFVFLFSVMAPALSAAAMTKAQVSAYWNNVCKTAKTDAEKEVSGLLWMGAGCAFNWLGVLGAYFLKTAPPAERLIGKPAAYATQYTKCYEQKAVDVQTSNAWIGCGIAGGVELIAIIVYFAFFASVVSSMPY